jgi:sporulation protein YlmC with PRC-barrel domain
MLVTIKALLGASVKSLQTGTEVAKTSMPLIDPRNLKLIALYVEGRMMTFSPAILLPSDIREVGPLGIIIDDAGKIVEPNDIVRIQEVVDFDFILENILVVDEKGHKIGRVGYYAFDPESYFVQQLYVKPTFGRSFKLSQIAISRSQIVDINNKKITVTIPTERLQKAIKDMRGADNRKPIIDNPFRKPRTAEETRTK